MNLLKISVSNDCNPVIAVDGSLTAVWVKELERVWQGFLSDHQAHDVKLDLSGVTFIDADGQRLLKSILVQGANVQEPQPLVKYIVERMRAELRHTTFEKEH
jgi:anti-anti-sigma regulatory factor